MSREPGGPAGRRGSVAVTDLTLRRGWQRQVLAAGLRSRFQPATRTGFLV